MGVFERRWLGSKEQRQTPEILRQRDLTRSIAGEDEQSRALNRFLQDVHQRVAQSVSAAVSIAEHAPRLRNLGENAELSGQNLSQASATIASTSEEIAATLSSELVPGTNQMSVLSRDVTDAVRTCESESQQVLSHISGISQSEEKLELAMAQLQEQVEEVSQVIGVIADISKRTNLLSLNAAIEAARAGEHGKGFAVVAEEVRRLAQHTTEATDQVTTIIGHFRSEMEQLRSAGESMQSAVAAGEAGVKSMGGQLSNVRQSMDELNDKVSAIATGTEQIGGAVSAMNQDVHTVSASAKQMLENALQFSEMARAMHDLSDQLLEGGLGGFKLAMHKEARSVVEAIADNQQLAEGNQEQTNTVLQLAIAKDSRFELFYLVDARGYQISDNILADLNKGVQVQKAHGQDWSSRHWFKAVLQEQQAHISDVYRSAATDGFCFTVAVPVFNRRGELARVLGADVRLSALVK